MLSSARYQERLARRSIALVLAGGRGSRLKQLTDLRAKPDYASRDKDPWVGAMYRKLGARMCEECPGK